MKNKIQLALSVSAVIASLFAIFHPHKYDIEIAWRTHAVEYPNGSRCERCGIPWNIADTHLTPYKNSYECFVLCEACWRELKTPKSRLPYYWNLFAQPDFGWDKTNWPAIKAAVIAGK